MGQPYRIYLYYFFLGCAICVMYPLYLLAMVLPSLSRFAISYGHRFCSGFGFLMSFVPVRLRYDVKLDRRKSYVFCANHFSFLDIPVLVLSGLPICFVGKQDLNRIPLFGFMFKQLHIVVDRTSVRSRYGVLEQASKRIREGKSVGFFPEGGRKSLHPPRLAPLKPGAFRVAIQHQIPVVPVSIPYNWRTSARLNGGKPYLKHLEAHFHAPIDTKGMTIKDVDALRLQVSQTLMASLKQLFPAAWTSS